MWHSSRWGNPRTRFSTFSSMHHPIESRPRVGSIRWLGPCHSWLGWNSFEERGEERRYWQGHLDMGTVFVWQGPPPKKTEASERIPGNSGMQTFSRHTVFLGVPRTSARGGSFKLNFWRKWRVMAAASLAEGSRMVPASTSTTLGWQWKRLSDIGEDWPCDISDVMEHSIAGQGSKSSW